MGLIRVAIALAALVFLGRRLYFFVQPPPFPTTEVPLPKTFVGCEITDPPTSETPIETIVVGATDPLPPSAVAGTITINGRHEVRNDLYLLAQNDLVVNGSLDVPGLPPVGTVSPNITLVSRAGRVVIAAGGAVGGGMAGGGRSVDVTTPDAIAVAHAGLNGGFIRIVAKIVDVAGTITGIQGGPGGRATAQAVPKKIAGKLHGGFARATAGAGGHGGDIRICADEVFIRATGKVHGSYAGGGQSATAAAANGRDAEAFGGNGGDPTNATAIPRAGNITFAGTPAKSCAVTVEAGGEVKAGALTPLASEGGDATATGGLGDPKGTVTGGRGYAVAGVGSTGGSVIFLNCTLTNHGAVEPGSGGIGGFAYSYGGDGHTSRFTGFNGGSADAFGGRGGLPGHIPFLHKDGRPGPGQQAKITTGAGGDATMVTGGGGHSGRGLAEGGANGAGQAGEYKPLARHAPVGQDGGGRESATAQGAPS